MIHSFLIESVRPDVVQELLQLLACGTRHTNRRKDEHYGLFDISWKTVCVQDICFITFINELLDNSLTHGLLIESCAVNWHFLSDLLLKVIDFLTICSGVVISQLYVGPCQSNLGLNSRSLTITPCKTFTFSIIITYLGTRKNVFKVALTTWSTTRISLTSYVEWIHSIDYKKEGNNLLNFIHKVLCNISGFLNGSLMINSQSFKIA